MGLLLCLAGFLIELDRGESGHLPAWAYVVEWPLFALVGTVMWWRLLREHHARDSNPASASPNLEGEPELLSWRQVVAQAEAGTAVDPEAPGKVPPGESSLR